ncbi:uncharacterized protein LOC122541178 [Chiloscyllium plagiosum]|uniref:uncharacterized protein LOC122541178 n=1 Tax=Chiloscyllium plagiosum TaxID=36176 RepID=UPI001CB84975|nr:uncharacterized protein LOC122541178 [Chiloscyllium plagiosum]
MQTVQRWMFLNVMTVFLQTDNVLMREVKVVQSPNVHVTEGESVQLNCTFDVLNTVGRIVWRRAIENMEISNSNPFYKRRLEKSGAELFVQGKAFIKLNRVLKLDSDFYYCEVEFPAIGSRNGTATQLVVTDKNRADRPPLNFGQLFSLMLGLLGLFTLVIIVLLSRLYCQHKALSRLKESHIVTQMKGNDCVHEEIEAQETSTGPRHETVLPFKSQISCVPVYSTVQALSAGTEITSSNQHVSYGQAIFHQDYKSY